MTILLPSAYEWLVPPFDIKAIDELASKNLFPTIEGLSSSLYYAVLFGVARIVPIFLLYLRQIQLHVLNGLSKQAGSAQLRFKIGVGVRAAHAHLVLPNVVLFGHFFTHVPNGIALAEQIAERINDSFDVGEWRRVKRSNIGTHKVIA